MQELSAQLPVVLRMSGAASVVIILVLALQWLLGRRLQPRWRCALWLLVLLRLALPGTVASPISLFNVLKTPVVGLPAQPALTAAPASNDSPVPAVAAAPLALTPASRVPWLAWIWLAGAGLLAACALVSQYRFRRRVGRLRPLIDEAALGLLEDCKTLMNVATPITLVETAAVKSPTLFGFVRPRLLLPQGLVATFSREELRHVFLHELAHIKRHDILTGWVALALQIMHWFNPLVWLAFHRLRADRELACDALALSRTRTGENEAYGLTIVKLLEGFDRAAWGPSLAGILEDKHQMKERIRMIAKFHKSDRGLALAVVLLAGLTLVTLTDAQNQTPAPAQSRQFSEPDAAKGVWAVRFEPVGDFAPQTPREFLDRIPIHSGQHGEIGYFRTQKQGDKLVGSFLASDGEALKAALNQVAGIRVTSVEKLTSDTLAAYEKLPQESLVKPAPAPQIVATTPAVGAVDVDPAVTEITVTFDRDMGGGMSWTGGGADFPRGPEGQRAFWRDPRTCVLPVKLEVGHYYRVGINSKSYRNFASKGGAPAAPAAIYFATQGASAEVKARVQTPQVVRLEPLNGAKDVSPALSEVKVTFNMPMGGGMSWCTVGDSDEDFPKDVPGKKIYWTPDRKTCVMPVTLKPGTTYRISLNAAEYKNFQSEGGVPLVPVIYTFKTGGQP